jgi:hypothetical protein
MSNTTLETVYIITPIAIKSQIPKNKQARWERERDDKYVGSELATFIKKELETHKGTGTRNAKSRGGYFKLPDAYHEIISTVKGVKHCQ